MTGAVPPMEQFIPLMHEFVNGFVRRAQHAKFVIDEEDIFQELSMVYLRCAEKFKPELGLKFITMFHVSMRNHLALLLSRYKTKLLAGMVISGDTTYENESGEVSGMWDRIESDAPNPEQLLEEEDLARAVANSLTPKARSMFLMLTSPTREVQRQFLAMRAGIALMKEEGEGDNMAPISKVSLQIDFPFLARLFGLNNRERQQIREEIEYAVHHFAGA